MASNQPSNEESKRMIRQLKLRSTPLRDELLKIFNKNIGIGFSENELKESISVPCDRTTVYRTIKILLEKAFIHKIICENGILKYAVSKTEPVPHIHFQCVKCQRVFCLNDYKIQTPQLPKEYEAQSYHLLVKGNCHHCPECNKSHK